MPHVANRPLCIPEPLTFSFSYRNNQLNHFMLCDNTPMPLFPLLL